MLMILIDAVVLIFLLQAFNDEEVEFVSALVISLATSIVTGILSVVLAIYLGLAGIVLTGVICALALGAALSRSIWHWLETGLCNWDSLHAHSYRHFYRDPAGIFGRITESKGGILTGLGMRHCFDDNE